MRIIQITALRGPNRYRLSPVLEVLLDTELRGGLARRLAKVVAELTINYQQMIGVPVNWHVVQAEGEKGVYRLAIACYNTTLARAALERALQAVSEHLRRPDNNPTAQELQQLAAIDLDPRDRAAQTDHPDKQIIAITGTNGKTTTVRLIAHIMQQAGKQVGWTSTDGSWRNQQQLERGDNSGPISALAILQRDDVEVAVLETARGGILREGLAYPHTDVAVITNVSSDHLGLRGVNTVAELARVKRVIVDALRRGGSAVLNAENVHTLAMAAHVPQGAQLLFFALDKSTPAMAAHLAAGGTGAYRNGAQLLLAHADAEQQITTLDCVPLTLNGQLDFHVQNVLAASLAAWASGASLPTIAAALACFQGDTTMNNGRFNRFSLRGATVIVDYGHNPAAAVAIGRAIATMPAQRRYAILTTAGDRRDEDMQDIGKAAAPYYDSIFTTDGRNQRGRKEGEIAQLIADGVTTVNPQLPVKAYADPDAAAREALVLLQPGDILLIAEDEFSLAAQVITAAGGTPS